MMQIEKSNVVKRNHFGGIGAADQVKWSVLDATKF